MSNIKSKILRTKTPLHSVFYKTAYFKINKVLKQKRTSKIEVLLRNNKVYLLFIKKLITTMSLIK